MIDLIAILGNVSQSLGPIQKFITGGAYLLSLIFIFTGFEKLKKLGDRRSQSSSQEKVYPVLMHFFIGVVLLYLPTALQVASNTAFGVGNVISYSNYTSRDVYSSMRFLIKTAGVIWFVRGCVLIVHASEPGTKQGSKGLLFIAAGIFAVNFDNTMGAVDYVMNSAINWSLQLKSSQGF